jgi:hypothetical protein
VRRVGLTSNGSRLSRIWTLDRGSWTVSTLRTSLVCHPFQYMSFIFYTVLCCAVLHCAVLYCAVPCCPVLCCAALYCAVLPCAVLPCTVLSCRVLCCAVLPCTVLCFAVPRCTVQHNASLSNTILTSYIRAQSDMVVHSAYPTIIRLHLRLHLHRMTCQ